MAEQIKAIETQYKGYRFRSRLEARWAVFLDALKVPWEYEVQGFDCGGVWYLPDFWLPKQEIYVDVKPDIDGLTPDTHKIEALAREGVPVYALIGKPWPWEYWAKGGCGACWPFPTAQWAYCPQCHDVSLIVSSLDSESLLASLSLNTHCACGRAAKNWNRPDKGSDPARCRDSSCILCKAYRAARSARFEHGESG